jgi:TonB family protein
MNLSIEYSLRVTLVLGLAFAATRMLRRQPAAFRHLIWICAFSIAAATPALMQFGPRILIQRSAPPATPQAAPIPASVEDSVDGSPPAPRVRKIPYLEILWIAGMLPFMIRTWNALRKARALLKNAIVLKIPSAQFARIAETDAVATPMTLGVFRPWILLPREHRIWDPELLRAVLLHELAHVRRRDCLVQWLPNIVCAVHWFNPLAWLARSEMLCESERACDDAVIRSGIGGSAFARDLIEIAQSIHSKGDSLMSTALTTKLERRITRLVDPAANRVPLTIARAVLGAMIVAALLAPIAGLRAEQVIKTPPAISLPRVTLEPSSMPNLVVASPKAVLKNAPRVVAQIAQAQIAQAAPPPQPSGTGSLSGIVSDPAGAVVAGATVLIYLVSGPGGSSTAVAGPTGQWSFPSLPAGTYTLEIQVPGFKAFNRTVTISPGIDSQLNANLQIGRSTETVTVTAERPNASAPSPSAQTSSKPIRVSAGVEPAKLIRHVTPVYPQPARDQGIQGSITFEAIINKAGFIDSPQLATTYASPDLVQAARDAIMQWQYTPARLNDEPVNVLTEITVNFTLQ